MRILIVTMQYPTAPGQSYLTTELADALMSAGHDVQVLHLDWAAPSSAAVEDFVTPTGVRVVRCAPKFVAGFGRLVSGATKFVLSGRRAARIAAAHFDLTGFDAAIAWMPASAISPLVRQLERAGVRHRLLFIWDFFPHHHHEIGRIPGGPPLWIARACEQRLIGCFTSIICTLPGNADYLRRKFRVRPDQRVLVTPIWGDISPVGPVDRAALRRRHDLPRSAPIAVFGGQLVEGRGFEQMLAAAAAASAGGSPLAFLFVGEGRLAAAIRARAETQTNLFYRPAVTRADYLELLGACDVGMIATVPGVTSFSFPSKTVDYLRAGLPIIAAIERGNEFAGILERYHVGTAVQFGDPTTFYASAERLALGGRISEAAGRCLEEIFDVRHAVATVLGAMKQAGEPTGMPARQPSVPRPRHRRSAALEPRRSRSGRRSARP